MIGENVGRKLRPGSGAAQWGESPVNPASTEFRNAGVFFRCENTVPQNHKRWAFKSEPGIGSGKHITPQTEK